VKFLLSIRAHISHPPRALLFLTTTPAISSCSSFPISLSTLLMKAHPLKHLLKMYADQAMYEFGQLCMALPDMVSQNQLFALIALILFIIYIRRANYRVVFPVAPATSADTTSPQVLAQLNGITKSLRGLEHLNENIKKVGQQYAETAANVERLENDQKNAAKTVLKVSNVVVGMKKDIVKISAATPTPAQDPNLALKLLAVESKMDQIVQKLWNPPAQPPPPVQDPQIAASLAAVLCRIDELDQQLQKTPAQLITPPTALSCSTIAGQTTAPTAMSAPELPIATGTSLSTALASPSLSALSLAPLVVQKTEPIHAQQPKLELAAMQVCATTPSELASQKLVSTSITAVDACPVVQGPAKLDVSTVQTSYESEPTQIKVCFEPSSHHLPNANHIQVPVSNEKALNKQISSQQSSINTLQAMMAGKNRSMSMMLEALTGMELKATRTTANGAKTYCIHVDENKLSDDTRQSFNTMNNNINDSLSEIADEHDGQLRELHAAAKVANITINKLRQEGVDADSETARISKTATKLTAELAKKNGALKDAEVTEKKLATADMLVNSKTAEMNALLEAFSGISISPFDSGFGVNVWQVQGDPSKLSGPSRKVLENVCEKVQIALDNAVFDLSGEFEEVAEETMESTAASLSAGVPSFDPLPCLPTTPENVEMTIAKLSPEADSVASLPFPVVQPLSTLASAPSPESTAYAPTTSKQVEKTSTKSSPDANMVVTPPLPAAQTPPPLASVQASEPSPCAPTTSQKATNMAAKSSTEAGKVATTPLSAAQPPSHPTPVPRPDRIMHNAFADICAKQAEIKATQGNWYCEICKAYFAVEVDDTLGYEKVYLTETHERECHAECPDCREMVSGDFDPVFDEVDLTEHKKVCIGPDKGKGKAQVKPSQKQEALKKGSQYCGNCGKKPKTSYFAHKDACLAERRALKLPLNTFDRDTGLPLAESTIAPPSPLERKLDPVPGNTDGLARCYRCSAWLPRTVDDDATFLAHTKSCPFKICSLTGCDLVVRADYFHKEETGHRVACKARRVDERVAYRLALARAPTVAPHAPTFTFKASEMPAPKTNTAAPKTNAPAPKTIGGATTPKASNVTQATSSTSTTPPRPAPKPGTPAFRTNTPASSPWIIPGLDSSPASTNTNTETASTAPFQAREVKNTTQKIARQSATGPYPNKHTEKERRTSSSWVPTHAYYNETALTEPSSTKEANKRRAAGKKPEDVPQFFSGGKQVLQYQTISRDEKGETEKDEMKKSGGNGIRKSGGGMASSMYAS
jgi:hypothetical protein